MENASTVSNTNNVGGFSLTMLKRNAIEKLLQYTKHSTLPSHRSNDWNYNVNIDEIESQRMKHYEHIFALVKIKEKEIEVTEKQMQAMSIFHSEYKPEFIKDIPQEQVEELTTLISEKIRNVKLAIVKSKINQYVKDDKKGVFMKGGRRYMSDEYKKKKLKPIVNVNSGVPLVFNKANYIRNLSRRRSSYFSPNPKDNFMYYKDSFEIRLRELTDPMNRLLMKKKKLGLPKIKSEKCSVEITEEDGGSVYGN